ncbi:FeoB small GTPase domain-containing protein [Candidatus Riflebacteria bacterium]
MQNPERKALLVGSPNVGKSSLFNQLTGSYSIISNYPGTTVSISHGVVGDKTLIDTPGMYSLNAISEDEKISLKCLSQPGVEVLLHVVDTKNLERMLSLTMELMETGIPVILVLNMIDELEPLGLKLDREKLASELGIPVLITNSAIGEGVDEVKNQLLKAVPKNPELIKYSEEIEKLISTEGDDVQIPNLSLRTSRLLKTFQEHEKGSDSEPFFFSVQKERFRWAKELTAKCLETPGKKFQIFQERVDSFLLNPWSGTVILFIVLYLGLYQFVGVFGAGTVVDYIQATIFGKYINPPLIQVGEKLLPFPHKQVLAPFSEKGDIFYRTSKYTIPEGIELSTSEKFYKAIFDLLVGEYGILTMGLTYAFALVLPIVFFFFIFFSTLEDSGYFPRLSLLIDRCFKFIGLNGRAVIPLVLGFGCDTMATVVTRILETRRQRILTAFLLALAIPCSAQMGAFAAVLSVRGSGVFWTWCGVVFLIFLVVGKLASLVFPEENTVFYMELPPLRIPQWNNIWLKTRARMIWYFFEVVPLFIFASVLIWLGQLTGFLDFCINALTPAIKLLGFSGAEKIRAMSETIIFGFFRRDYSAAHLYEIQKGAGQHMLLSQLELLTISVILTLFLPCIAQFLIMLKEFGIKVTLISSGTIIMIAFWGGVVVNRTFLHLGWLL